MQGWRWRAAVTRVGVDPAVGPAHILVLTLLA